MNEQFTIPERFREAIAAEEDEAFFGKGALGMGPIPSFDSTLTYETFRDAMRDILVDHPPLRRMVISTHLTMQQLTHMCKSKKKRIRKKWLKNPRNYRTVPFDGAYSVDGMILCHPSVASQIRMTETMPPYSCD